MKKIIISSNIIWTITQFRLGLIKFLRNKNIDITCLADVDNFSKISEQKVKDSGAKYIKTPLSRKGLNPFLDVLYFINLIKIYKSEKPDLVINYTIKPIIYGSIAAFFLKIPSFAVTTGLGFVFINKGLLSKFIRLLYKLSLRFPTKVFFLNNDDYKLFRKYNLVSNNKCIIIPGEGIDTEYYKPIPKQDSSKFKFLMIARLLIDKGVYEYIGAAQYIINNFKFNNVEFLLLGYIDNNNPSAIKKEIIDKWHDDKIITYLGTVEDSREIILSSDCIVLPSYREGVPRVLLEGASMGKPIITTNTVGCKDVVEDNVTGFLCKIKDSEDLSQKMLKLLSLSNEELSSMGANGREKVIKEFDENIIFNIYWNEISNIS